MAGEPREKYVFLAYKSFIAFGLGVALTLLYQFLSSPIYTMFAVEKSPSGKYVCVIDEYSPWLWTGPPVPYLAFRIYSSDEMQPLENESQSIWYEYESRGRGIDRGSLGIAWNGDTATISDANGPAAEWNPIDQWNQKVVSSKPASSPAK